jgi:hypothetical protein
MILVMTPSWMGRVEAQTTEIERRSNSSSPLLNYHHHHHDHDHNYYHGHHRNDGNESNHVDYSLLRIGEGESFAAVKECISDLPLHDHRQIKPEIVFFHISKAGGTALCTYCGKQGLRVLGRPGTNCKTGFNGAPNGETTCQAVLTMHKYFQGAAKMTLDLVALENDHGIYRARLSILLQPRARFITILREPISHRWSARWFFPISQRSSKGFARMTFMQWFEMYGSHLANEVYTRVFSDAPVGKELTNDDLVLAIETLSRIDLVAILDSCDNFQNLFCSMIATKCNNESLPFTAVLQQNYKVANMTQDEHDFIVTRAARFDIQLFEHARSSISPCIG